MSCFFGYTVKKHLIFENLDKENIIVYQNTGFEYKWGPRLACRGPKNYQKQLKNHKNELFFGYTVKTHPILENLDEENIIVYQNTGFEYKGGPRLACRGPKNHHEQIKDDQNELFFGYTVKKHQILGNFDKENIRIQARIQASNIKGAPNLPLGTWQVMVIIPYGAAAQLL